MNCVLSVDRLSKRFSGVQALEQVDVDVLEGEVLGLVGPNGSGKTTLFNCVTGFVQATSGSVTSQGRDITNLAPDQIARLGVVRTFQQKMVFPRATVRENLAIAWQATGRSRINGAGASQFKGSPDLLRFLGLTRMADFPAEDIPFGFARKLGLGLALAAGPRLLLLDEPAAGLNQDESKELGTLIGSIKQLGITVWIIEHDMELVMSISDRIIVLHAGRKIAEGQPQDVASDPGVVSVYLGEKFARRTSG